MDWIDDSSDISSALQLLVDSLPAYVSFVDADERYRLVNRRYEEYFGVEPQSLIGQRLRDVQPPAAYAEMEPHTREALAGREVRYQLHPISPGGKEFWFDVRYVPHRDHDGVVSGFFALVFDITDAKRSEIALRESQLRLETLVQNLPGMAYRCQNDLHWTMTHVSDGCEALTGYQPNELEQSRCVSFGDLVHPEDRDWLAARCQASLEARTPCQNEYRIIDKQGRERWVSDRATGVYDADGNLLYIDGFVQDITANREATLAREQIERKMLEAQKLESLGVLAGGIAHDFNNILTGILGNASLGLMSLPPGSQAEQNLQDITEAAFRAADLCRQMLAYSGKAYFLVQKVDLGHLIETTMQMLQLSISKKAMLQLQLARQLPAIEADATQLQQVIMNLVMNASEAIGDADGVIRIGTGVISVDRAYLADTATSLEPIEGDYVFIEVSDSGCGMSAETQSHIFEPFFTTKFTGRGLGLAAVLGIVRAHRGALKVRSEVGRGTTFTLLFPAASGPLDTAGANPVAGTGRLGTGTALVVDDEESIRTAVARMLRAMGFEAVLAADGREALDVFRADPDRFAFVLLDLTMPHLDGEQTFSELRRLRPHARVVLMSGFSQPESPVRFAGQGPARFLQKPFGFEAMRDVLQSLLG